MSYVTDSETFHRGSDPPEKRTCCAIYRQPANSQPTNQPSKQPTSRRACSGSLRVPMLCSMTIWATLFESLGATLGNLCVHCTSLFGALGHNRQQEMWLLWKATFERLAQATASKNASQMASIDLLALIAPAPDPVQPQVPLQLPSETSGPAPAAVQVTLLRMRTRLCFPVCESKKLVGWFRFL